MYSPNKIVPLLLGTGAIAWSAPALAHPQPFDVPAQPAASGIQSFARQAGWQVLVAQELTRGKRTSAIKGRFETRDALARLLRGTGLDVLSIDGTVVTLGHPAAPPTTRAARAYEASSIIVEGQAQQPGVTRPATAVVDSIAYDDLRTVAGGDGSVVEQLVRLPGIAGVEEGDTPRFISIRGISADLNSTLIDGISVASVGSDGDGSRQVNLQLVPANMSSRNEVYKTFTPELPGDAIGGVVNIITRSAFAKKGLYTALDGYGIYSTFRGPAGINAIEGSGSHWGEGIKGVVSDRFGPDRQFGIILTGEYQNRIRNSSKYWQGTKYYFNNAGKLLSGPDDPSWNGLTVPYDQQYASYTNQLRSYGGSAKLEWRSSDDQFYVSLLGFARRRYEISTMNKQDLYTKSAVYDQTEDGGRQQINSVYTRYRFDHWDRRLYGTIADFVWSHDKNLLQIRGGYNQALYDNHQPYVVARAYPSSAYVTYSSNSAQNGLPYITSVSDPTIFDPSRTAYKLSTAYVLDRSAREDLGNMRVDYGYNAAREDRGVGFAVGAEWRRITLRRDVNETEYKTGSSMTKYLFDSGYTPAGSAYRLPWIDYAGFSGAMAGLTVDTASSAYDSAVSDYRYAETVVTPYAALHYTTDRLSLVWGVRLDHTRFAANTPTITGSSTVSGQSLNRGGYDYGLPSISAEFRLNRRTTASLSLSRSIGRPTPGDVAQAQSTSCGEQDNGSEACTISRGNPDLRPRRATNLDLTLTHSFNHRHGLVGISLFGKWLADDIFTLTSQTMVGDTAYTVTQPMNADNSRIYGLEMRAENNGLKLAGQTFDLFANMTLMKGHMNVTTGSGTRSIDRLIYQPDMLANAGATWHMPFLRGGLTAQYNYRGKYLEDIGTTPQTDDGRDGYGTLDLSLWHKVTRFATLKYEFVNALGEKPRWLIGNRLQYVSEVDNYGRTIMVHLIIR